MVLHSMYASQSSSTQVPLYSNLAHASSFLPPRCRGPGLCWSLDLGKVRRLSAAPPRRRTFCFYINRAAIPTTVPRTAYCCHHLAPAHTHTHTHTMTPLTPKNPEPPLCLSHPLKRATITKKGEENCALIAVPKVAFSVTVEWPRG